MRCVARYVTLVLALALSRADALVIESATRPDFSRHQWQVRQYDRSNGRPAEVGGHAGDMASLTATDWDVNFTYSYTYSVDYPCSGHRHPCRENHHCGPTRATLTITSFHINGRQKTTLFIPNDAPPLLKAHEQAHFDLNVYTYDQAFYRSRIFSRRMLGRTFVAQTLEQAQSQVNDLFNHEFRERYAHWRDDLHEALNQLDGNGSGPGLPPDLAYRQVIASHK